MALTLSTAAKNAAADAVVDLIDVGAGTATMVIKDSGGTALCTINLADPAFGAASSGTATLLGVPLSGTAGATGTASTFDVEDQDGTVVYSGTVGIAGSGADAIIDNASITSGDTVQLDSHTITMP